MAVGTTAALLIGGAAFSAGSSIMGANNQAKAIEKQAEYNAQIYEQQGTMIQEQKKLSEYQFNRNRARARGSIKASAAGKGFELGGSPMSILIDNETQMLFDEAINNYNLDISANYAKSAAASTRQAGLINSRATRYSGYTNAFSTILNTGAQIGMMNIKPPAAGKL